MMPPSGPPGPFDSEREARELPAVREVYEAFRADPGVGKMTAPNLSMLLDALAAAGVYLGPYDHRIAEWLANWEPQTVAVIAGWVQRASEGPPGRETGGDPLPEGTASTPPGHHHAPEAAGMRITRGGDGGRAPHEATPP
jgi:hypothetical protein